MVIESPQLFRPKSMSIYTGDEEVHKNFTILARDGTPVRGEDDPPGFFYQHIGGVDKKIYIYIHG